MLLEYLERLSSERQVEDVWSHHCEEMARHGFDRLIYGFTRFSTENSVGAIEDAIILSNHESSYFRKFIHEGHYEHAPLVRWGMKNTGSVSWRLIGETYEAMSPEERAVVDLNRANGVVAGYSISFPQTFQRTRGIIALCARPGLTQDDVEAIWARDGREIEVKCAMLHLKVMTMPVSSVRPGLTPRQIEVLEWVAEGKTNQDIATIMGVSPATVEKHLRLAREKLDVDTTAQAVVKASFQNQMFLI